MFKGTDLLRQAVKPPKQLAARADCSDWERFVFQSETFLALIDEQYPKLLDEARRETSSVLGDVESMEYRILSVKLFGMLTSWTQESNAAVKIARSVQNQSGFELWRLLWQEFHPERTNKALMWRRALLSPKFPAKEQEFSAALQEWENDIDRYAAEYGAEKAIADEDKRALLVVESPSALKQHLAIHASTLTSYKSVREVVVSYLQAKRVWVPTAAYASHHRPKERDPNAMDIDRIGDKGKGKGDGKGKGKGKNEPKGGKKGDKGKGKNNSKDGKGKDDKRCPICWRTGHEVQNCWFNSKGAGKGKQEKGGKGVNAVADDNASVISAGCSASQVGVSQASQVSNASTAKPGVRHVSGRDTVLQVTGGKNRQPARRLLVDTGASTSVCRPGTFRSPVDASHKQALYSVDDTPLRAKGLTEPRLAVGSGKRRNTVHTAFQVVEGITDDILSVNRAVDAGAYVVFGPQSWIEWPDGKSVNLQRENGQFFLGYKELGSPSSQAEKIAAVGDVGESIPEDPEAEAVEEFAAQQLAQQLEQEVADEHPEQGEAEQALEQHADPPDPLPVAAGAPDKPTPEEVTRHNLTHVPYAPWCEACVCGSGRENQHRRQDFTGTEDLEAIVQMDYTFLSRNAHQEEVEGEATLVTILNLVDKASGWPLSIQVPRKGAEKSDYVMDAAELYLNNLGHKRVTLQVDQENAIRHVAWAIQKRMGSDKVKVRESPRYSHQSQGAIEGEHSRLAGSVRTWLMDLQARYPNCMVDVNHVVFPWLVRHVAWLHARFAVRTRDKMTSYRIINGVDYLSSICTFGETVMARLPKPGTKTQQRWVKGVWVGRLERDNSHILLTGAGALTVRSVRRLPEEAQKQVATMAIASGLPWEPRWGRRVRIAPPQKSDVVVLPALPFDPEEKAGEHGPDEGEGPPGIARDQAENRRDAERDAVEGHELAENVEEAPEEPNMDDYDPDLDAPVPDSEQQGAGATASRPAVSPAASPGGSPVARGSGWSSSYQGLSPSAPFPSGLGAGGIPPREEPRGPAMDPRDERPAKQPRQEPKKSSRIGKICEQDLWKEVQKWAESQDSTNPFSIQRLASVTEYLDNLLDPELVQEARLAQLRKLWDRGAFEPVHKSQVPKGSQVFHYTWVDKARAGVHKSRFTCADVKKKYTPEMEQDMRTFVPTPCPESHALLEITALKKDHAMRTFDIVAAFLIGTDRGAQIGEYVYMRPPPEWWPIFQEWVRGYPPEEQKQMLEDFKSYLFRLDGNLYGRRTAGSVYRDEWEDILVNKLKGPFAFRRGVKDPCVYFCEKTGIVVVHHVDDVRCAGPTAELNRLIDVEIPKHCEIQSGPLEVQGVSVEVLGKTKTRIPGAILTAPDPKHSKNIIKALGVGPKEKSQVPSKRVDLTNTEPLSDELAARYRSATGSGIYLSADRRDIQYAVKELARHMAAPRQCDWDCALVLGRYLQTRPDMVRVTALDPDAYEGPLILDVFSDSDWAGCVETRRSTDSHVACLGGGVVAVTSQTQPGLPATSSPDAELRGMSRACREALFIHDLAVMDFGLEVQVPRLWADSSTGITAGKRIGPGTKLRHLDVCEFYVQGAVQAGKIQLRKVKGTQNPANFLTKHAKSGPEVDQALASIGMADARDISGAQPSESHAIKGVRANPPTQWKPMYPFSPKLGLIAGITALQVLGVKGQGRELPYEAFFFSMFLLGLLTFLVGTGWCLAALTRRGLDMIRPGSESEPEPEEDERPERAEPPQEQPAEQREPAEEREVPREARVAPPEVREPVREARDEARGSRDPPRQPAPRLPEPEPEEQRPPEAGQPARPADADRGPQLRQRQRHPFRRPGFMYVTRYGRRAHVFMNCSGLADVPEGNIQAVPICQYCTEHRDGNEPLSRLGRVRLRDAIPERGAHRPPIVHLLDNCPHIQWIGPHFMAICMHCRNGSMGRDMG